MDQQVRETKKKKLRRVNNGTRRDHMGVPP